MTSLDKKAAEAIEGIFELLGGGHLNEIEERIDRAVERFTFDEPASFSTSIFHKVITDFVRHVYEHGLALQQKLSPVQGCAEAIAILEAHYKSTYANGYEAALLDAASPEGNGLLVVISAMAGAIKERERQRYSRWIYASRLDSLDWKTRCRVAEILIDRNRLFLPQELLHWDPALLASDIHGLMNLILHADGFAQQILTES